MLVLFRVRPVAIPILEINAEILDRLAGQLCNHPRGNLLRYRAGWEPESSRESALDRRVISQRLPRELTQPFTGGRPEQMGASVKRVHRLAAGGIPRIGSAKSSIRFAQVRGCVADFS